MRGGADGREGCGLGRLVPACVQHGAHVTLTRSPLLGNSFARLGLGALPQQLACRPRGPTRQTSSGSALGVHGAGGVVGCCGWACAAEMTSRTAHWGGRCGPGCQWQHQGWRSGSNPAPRLARLPSGPMLTDGHQMQIKDVADALPGVPTCPHPPTPGDTSLALCAHTLRRSPAVVGLAVNNTQPTTNTQAVDVLGLM